MSAKRDRADESRLPFHGRSEPYVRWWWLSGPFSKENIQFQLKWMRDNGFGGVEIAWIRPVWRALTPLTCSDPTWLSPEWADLVAFTKEAADSIGLGCDFTFGSAWPFGGRCVTPELALQDFHGNPRQRMVASWEHPDEGFVVNHLNRHALTAYAASLMPAFAAGLAGPPSALFCDSLELETRQMWSPQLWAEFEQRFGYDLQLFADRLDDLPDERYDYRKTVSAAICREFFEPFTAICHEHGTLSRVQCHGAPTDLLSAYAAVDIPESEALLFHPSFSRIAASAAALCGKRVVSAETFTCLYGFLGRDSAAILHWKEEQALDLKLLADAVFAHGVNQIVWHGMPFNPPDGENEFYASTHVGPDASFVRDIPALNHYFTSVCSLLKQGTTCSQLALYLPLEDNWMRDRIAPEDRTPGANFHWELRHVVPPVETQGFQPLWISLPFLQRAKVVEGRMQIGPLSFPGLLVDVKWLDTETLDELLRLAAAGLPLAMRRPTREPGRCKSHDYDQRLRQLMRLPTVHPELSALGLRPLLTGQHLPPFWARETEDALYIFFAQPAAATVRYPMRYRQSQASARSKRSVVLDWRGMQQHHELEFLPHQSIVLRIAADGATSFVDIDFAPFDGGI